MLWRRRKLTEYSPSWSVVTNPCCCMCNVDSRLNCGPSSSAQSGGVRYSALPCSGNSRRALSWNPVNEMKKTVTSCSAFHPQFFLKASYAEIKTLLIINILVWNISPNTTPHRPATQIQRFAHCTNHFLVKRTLNRNKRRKFLQHCYK
jgi:hypothetical protein